MVRKLQKEICGVAKLWRLYDHTMLYFQDAFKEIKSSCSLAEFTVEEGIVVRLPVNLSDLSKLLGMPRLHRGCGSLDLAPDAGVDWARASENLPETVVLFRAVSISWSASYQPVALPRLGKAVSH